MVVSPTPISRQEPQECERRWCVLEEVVSIQFEHPPALSEHLVPGLLHHNPVVASHPSIQFHLVTLSGRCTGLGTFLGPRRVGTGWVFHAAVGDRETWLVELGG